MRRWGALILGLLLTSSAWAQGVPGQSWTNAVLNAPTAATPPSASDVVPIIQGGITKQLPYSGIVPVSTNFSNSVSNLAAAQLGCTASSGCPLGSPTFTSGFWRLSYGNGNGASPVFYTPSNSACSLNSGNGDNGSQIKSADGKCWLAVFPHKVADVLQFGCIGDSATNNGNGAGGNSCFANALTYISSVWGNGTVIVPPAQSGGVYYCVPSGLTVPANVQLLGTGQQATGIAACGGNTNPLVTLTGNAAVVQNFFLQGKGAGKNNSLPNESFSASAPTILVANGCVRCAVYEVETAGGLDGIDNNGVDTVLHDVHIFTDYRYGLYNNNDALWAWRLQIDDHSWGACSATVIYPFTINNWAANHTYGACAVVDTQGYWIGTVAGGISGSGAPTLQPFGSNITDNTVTWFLIGPDGGAGFVCDTGATELHVDMADLSGANLHNFLAENSLSGTACNTVAVTHSVVSVGYGDGVALTAGSDINFSNDELLGCAGTSCAVVSTSGTWSRGLTITSNPIISMGTFSINDGAGSGSVISNNQFNLAVSGGQGINERQNDFSIMGNIFSGAGAAAEFSNAVSRGSFIGNNCHGAAGGLTNNSSITGSGVNANSISGNQGC